MDGFKTTKSHKITSQDGHQLYVEESGPSSGIPALFLHGGPGAGMGQHYQWLFAGANYRLIAFDQRGCGRSLPAACLDNNNTAAHIEDIELIREFFGIDQWLVFGGSWGSTLGLVYAIEHPSRVLGMILRGIFLAREADTDWFLSPQGGAAQVFCEEYAEFSESFSFTNSRELCSHFFKKLNDENEKTRIEYARRWFNWEGNISKLKPSKLVASQQATKAQVYSLALMECYYLMNNCFIDENFILDNTKAISHIPMHIIHGRYDMVCKFEAASSLHQQLPKSKLFAIDNAGHSMAELGINKALNKSLHYFSQLLDES